MSKREEILITDALFGYIIAHVRSDKGTRTFIEMLNSLVTRADALTDEAAAVYAERMRKGYEVLKESGRIPDTH